MMNPKSITAILVAVVFISDVYAGSDIIQRDTQVSAANDPIFDQTASERLVEIKISGLKSPIQFEVDRGIEIEKQAGVEFEKIMNSRMSWTEVGQLIASAERMQFSLFEVIDHLAKHSKFVKESLDPELNTPKFWDRLMPRFSKKAERELVKRDKLGQVLQVVVDANSIINERRAKLVTIIKSMEDAMARTQIISEFMGSVENKNRRHTEEMGIIYRQLHLLVTNYLVLKHTIRKIDTTLLDGFEAISLAKAAGIFVGRTRSCKSFYKN